MNLACLVGQGNCKVLYQEVFIIIDRCPFEEQKLRAGNDRANESSKLIVVD